MLDYVCFQEHKTFNLAFQEKRNQSRICGKEVGLSLPSDSLESQSYEFIEIGLIGPYNGVE